MKNTARNLIAVLTVALAGVSVAHNAAAEEKYFALNRAEIQTEIREQINERQNILLAEADRRAADYVAQRVSGNNEALRTRNAIYQSIVPRRDHASYRL